MLQYLLNTTAIWLTSLVLFDVFLRRESYHGYNRSYLLFTFLLGLLLPLFQLWDTGMAYTKALDEPIHRVITAKQNIIAATAPATNTGWVQWLTGIYFAGVLVALCLLIIDVVKLMAFYRKGKQSQQGGWIVVETGKDHAPFSFMNTLFVCSMQQYSNDEWQMILAHEKRHSSLYHFADLLLMQLARIVFWFHPLVYVYNKRLLLVHEYQADNASAREPQVYGRFLVEQALLQAAPSVTHSFNRSPIKNRIVMLTRKSTAVSKIKMFVFIPLALVCIVCFSKNSFSQKFERKGNMVTYRGNTFEYYQNTRIDTQVLVDPVTNEQIVKYIKFDPVIVKMNDRDIPKDVDQQPSYTGSEKNLRDYLVIAMKNELSKLDDGQYALDITNILIDENGKIVYFEYHEMKRSRTQEEIPNNVPKQNPEIVTVNPKTQINVSIGGSSMPLQKNTNPAYYEEISKSNQQAIFDKVCKLMETAPGFKPATLHGKKVVSMYYCPMFWNHFKVKDHKLYDMAKNGGYKEL
jgi:beta-lactamase regulating signal transducer with metallopeptidase domain